MWLDRISGHSKTSHSTVNSSNLDSLRNPSPPQRSSSSSQLTRGTHNDSTTSLLSLSTTPQSQAQGQQKTRSRPKGVADPLQVLNGILNKSPSPDKPSADVIISGPIIPDLKPQLVHDIAFDGRSLQEFVADSNDQTDGEQPEVDTYTVQQFEEEKSRFQDLHTAITGCDDVSRSVELYLGDFQRELGVVSAEIESLQARSVQLNAMLENRRNVQRLLGPAVDEITISPRGVRRIVEGPIDSRWVRTLNEIDLKTTNIESKGSLKAVEHVRPLLAAIRKKVRTSVYSIAISFDTIDIR